LHKILNPLPPNVVLTSKAYFQFFNPTALIICDRYVPNKGRIYLFLNRIYANSQIKRPHITRAACIPKWEIVWSIWTNLCHSLCWNNIKNIYFQIYKWFHNLHFYSRIFFTSQHTMTRHQQSSTWHGFDTTSIYHWTGIKPTNFRPWDKYSTAKPQLGKLKNYFVMSAYVHRQISNLINRESDKLHHNTNKKFQVKLRNFIFYEKSREKVTKRSQT